MVPVSTLDRCFSVSVYGNLGPSLEISIIDRCPHTLSLLRVLFTRTAVALKATVTCPEDGEHIAWTGQSVIGALSPGLRASPLIDVRMNMKHGAAGFLA